MVSTIDSESRTHSSILLSLCDPVIDLSFDRDQREGERKKERMVARGLLLLLIRRSSSAGGSFSQHRFASTTVDANAGGDAAPVAAKRSRAGLWFVAIAGAAGIGVLAYPQLVTAPAAVPAPLLPPPTKPPVAPVVAAATAPAVVEPPKPKVLSPREELDQRVSNLKDELADLRKQKRSKIVDMKKRSIKDEIKIIENGIKKLERA